MSCCQQPDGGDRQRLIQSLRAEIDALGHQTGDIYECMDHLSSLKHELDQLSLSRQSQDTEFALKHDNALHLIAELKGEVERLKNEIRNSAGGDDLQEKINELRKRLEDLNCQIQKMLSNIEAQLRDRENMLAEREKLLAQLDHLHGLKGKSLEEIKKLRKDNDSVFKRRGQGEHYLRDLEHEARDLQSQIPGLQAEAQELKMKGKGADELIEQLERSVDNSQRHLKKLQMDSAQLTSIFDRLKNELFLAVKGLQNELNKNALESERIVHGENLLANLENELSKTSSSELDAEIEKLERESELLERELENNRAHVENLFNQNNQLVTQIELMAEDDEKIRGMLERRPMAMRVRSKLDRHYAMARRALDSNDCGLLGQPLC